MIKIIEATIKYEVSENAAIEINRWLSIASNVSNIIFENVKKSLYNTFLESPENKVWCNVRSCKKGIIDISISLDKGFFNKHIGKLIREAQDKEALKFTKQLESEIKHNWIEETKYIPNAGLPKLKTIDIEILI